MAQAKEALVADVQAEVLALAALYPQRDELLVKLASATEQVDTLSSQIAEVDEKIIKRIDDIKGKVK